MPGTIRRQQIDGFLDKLCEYKKQYDESAKHLIDILSASLNPPKRLTKTQRPKVFSAPYATVNVKLNQLRGLWPTATKLFKAIGVEIDSQILDYRNCYWEYLPKQNRLTAKCGQDKVWGVNEPDEIIEVVKFDGLVIFNITDVRASTHTLVFNADKELANLKPQLVAPTID